MTTIERINGAISATIKTAGGDLQDVWTNASFRFFGGYGGDPCKTEADAVSLAQRLIARGVVRVCIQQVGATAFRDGRSDAQDDHWVAAPGSEYWVWIDCESAKKLEAGLAVYRDWQRAKGATTPAERDAQNAKLVLCEVTA